MGFKLVLILFICIATVAMATRHESTNTIRERRDVMETMKGAWNDVSKTFSDAGDSVVQVFKPTEKSVVDKVADGIKGIGQ